MIRGGWNINQLSIDYACRPRLRSRLTQGGRTLPWKPWSYGEYDSHIFRYLLARSLKSWFTFRMRISLHTSYIHASLNPLRANANLICHSITCTAGAGISTCCPSTTPFGLALGPDLPRADEPSPGNLGLSVCRILTCISLLTPAFSLPDAPILLTVYLQR